MHLDLNWRCHFGRYRFMGALLLY